MGTKPRINPAVIDLITRVFNSHKKGLPEWLKNSREAYLRKNIPEEGRFIIINYRKDIDPPYCTTSTKMGLSGREVNRHIHDTETAGFGLRS